MRIAWLFKQLEFSVVGQNLWEDRHKEWGIEIPPQYLWKGLMQVLKTMFFQILSILMLTCGVTSISAQTPPVTETQVKAVFLFNFTQFVEWPAHAFSTSDTPFVIGILGKDPFGAYLDEIVSGEKTNGRPMVIHRFSNAEEVKDCHILFINLANTDVPEAILGSLKGKSLLIVSDSENLIHQGGMIRFMKINRKIRFQINPDAAKAADLTISSKLLNLAEIVTLEKK